MGRSHTWLRSRGAFVALAVVLVLCTGGFSLGSLAAAVVFHLQIGDVRANRAGDPEKEFMDNCMRDFEGLPPSDVVYVSARQVCIDDMKSNDRQKWVPAIRLTVDDQVCGQAELCDTSDPGQCADTGGDVFGHNYQAGAVTQCYQLMDQARRTLSNTDASALSEQFQLQCRAPERWQGYKHKVQLEYCMWKHGMYGVCTNERRATCPDDSSCCPVAQSYTLEDGTPAASGPDRYTCRQSPVAGLYCQSLDYVQPGDASNGTLCTAATCGSFGWCRDLFDIPGSCQGEACLDHQRVQSYSVLLVCCAAVGFLFDLVDCIVLARFPKAVMTKTWLNSAGACMKLLGAAFVAVSGALEFLDDAIDHRCFNVAGNDMVESVHGTLMAFVSLAILAALGSLVLAFVGAALGGDDRAETYARFREDGP